MAKLLSSAGYRSVALTLPPALLADDARAVKACFQECGLETFTRVDLACSNRHELLKLLRRYRNQYDVISVTCLNQNVSAVACRDRRVDIILIDPRSRNVKFTHTLARLLHGALELNLSSALDGQFETIGRMMKQAYVAREHSVDVVLSSGCNSPLMIRNPLQLMAFGLSVGLKEEQARNGISAVPSNILALNSQRRSPSYIEDGVRVITKATSD
jgi:RNase P/RNase MRP subunit p30